MAKSINVNYSSEKTSAVYMQPPFSKEKSYSFNSANFHSFKKVPVGSESKNCKRKAFYKNLNWIMV